MGVDYRGNFGIGVKLKNIDFESEKTPQKIKKLECMCEYVDEVTKSSNFEYIETGKGAYTGEANDFFICIKKPFENGIDGLHEKFRELKTFLSDNNIEFEGEIGLVGGLHVY